MSRDDIIRLAREAGMERVLDIHKDGTRTIEIPHPDLLERFAALVAAAEREACAKVCEEKKEYSMPIPCPDGISGCLVAHAIPARREKTGSECAADIRARGEK